MAPGNARTLVTYGRISIITELIFESRRRRTGIAPSPDAKTAGPSGEFSHVVVRLLCSGNFHICFNIRFITLCYILFYVEIIGC